MIGAKCFARTRSKLFQTMDTKDVCETLEKVVLRLHMRGMCRKGFVNATTVLATGQVG